MGCLCVVWFAAFPPPGSSTASVLAIVHFGSVGRLWGLFERSKVT